MTAALRQFIDTARRLALERGLSWNPPFDENGVIDHEHRWNLSGLLASPSPVWFSSFGWRPKMLKALESLDLESICARPKQNFLEAAWREFCQAALIDLVLVQNQAPHGTYRLTKTVKLLAWVAGDVGPAHITGDHVRLAYNIALRMGDVEAARVFPGVVRKLFDHQHLALRPNLASSCTPYADADSLAAQALTDAANARTNSKGYRSNSILKHPNERKEASKLPDHRAFWELCRIVFTEEPRSLHDLQLFACARLHIITGLRAAEIALLPYNWEKWREWTDIDGNPAGLKGGITRSLAIRHFAGKQGAKSKGGGTRQLVPKLQDVPKMFEDIVLDTLHEVENATLPLRRTYGDQIASGRLFPDLPIDALVPIWEVYVRVFGNIQIASHPIPKELLTRYKQGSFHNNFEERNFRFDPSALDEIRFQQMRALGLADSNIPTEPLNWKIGQYFSDSRSKISSSFFRDETGSFFRPERAEWGRIHFRVGEVEAELSRKGFRKTLLEPSMPVHSEDAIAPHQFLFLTAYDKGGIRTDTNTFDAAKFFAVRRFNTDEVTLALGNSKDIRHLTLFSRYGRNDEDRSLYLETHSLRHLQNTELFRKGLADAIITKRFDRVSVQQSYVYDHRSLAEHLDNIDISDDIEERLGAKASTTYRLILSGRVSGPLVDRFQKIQVEEGDDQAFEFLVAEADGLHATPYGFCLNSFTVDPCPNHLECFNGCLHLARTDLPSEQQRLTTLRARTANILQKARDCPGGSVGRRNQIAHAQNRLDNIDKALATAPGDQPFPDGSDLSNPVDVIARATTVDRAPPLNDFNSSPDAADG